VKNRDTSKFRKLLELILVGSSPAHGHYVPRW